MLDQNIAEILTSTGVASRERIASAGVGLNLLDCTHRGAVHNGY